MNRELADNRRMIIQCLISQPTNRSDGGPWVLSSGRRMKRTLQQLSRWSKLCGGGSGNLATA